MTKRIDQNEGGSFGLLSSPQQRRKMAPELSFDEKKLRCLDYAISIFGNYYRDGKIEIPFVDGRGLEVFGMYEPVYQRIGYEGDEKLLGYNLKPERASDLFDLYLTDRSAANAIRLRLVSNIKLGFPLHESERNLLAGILTETTIAAPTSGNAPRNKSRDILIVGVSIRVSEQLGIAHGATKTRLSQRPFPLCGVLFATAALRAFDIKLELPRVDAVYRERQLPIDIYQNYSSPLQSDTRPDVNHLAFLSEPTLYVDASRYSLERDRALKWLDW